ncbi:MAG: putative Ig domain-containing protein [Candidatus Berkelbacteria bacterium]|nr:putative Ig domain-containing protein [Candidatus Berkelbacteria bacterium]
MGRKKMRWIAIGVAVLGLLLVVFSLNFQAFDPTGEKIYVATTGNDNNDGTIDRPFLTLDKAKARVRQIKAANSSTPITVLARGGTYYMDTPLNLSAADSGSAGAPITYASYPGETAVITGAKEVSFQSVTDQNLLSQLPELAKANVKMADLSALGLADFNPARRGAFLPNKPSGPTLSVNNQPMIIARYPNVGSWAEVATPTTDVANGFQYNDPEFANCSRDNNAFVHGFWYFGWADSHLKVGATDLAIKSISIEGGFDSYGVRAKTKPDEQFGRFYCYNVAQELDSPGEYIFVGDKLLFWPPVALEGTLTTVTIAEKLITGTGVKHLRFERLNFEGSRSNAVSFTSSSFLKFSLNVFNNIGNDALLLNNVTDSVVTSSDFHNLQERALNVKGGNPTTLVSSNDVIINNFIEHTAQWINASRAAIRIEGVGIKVYQNEVTDNPQGAVTFVGNDHDISKNFFHNNLKEGADTATVYGGRDPTYQGNKITYNYFKNNGNKTTTDFPGYDIYLDDALQNVLVEGNIVDGSARSFLLGGGSYNVSKNNIFTAPGRFDCRGCMSPTRSEFAANKFHNPITAVDADGSDQIITLANLHGIVDNVYATAPKTIKVVGVEGLNGTWNYKVVSPDQLRLLNASGSGNYTGGGYTYSPYGNVDVYDQLASVKNNPAYAKYAHLFDWEALDNLGDAVGNVFEGNIFYLTGGSAKPWVAMDLSAPEFFSPNNNIVYGSNGSPTIPPGNSIADPQFVDAPNGNFQLKPTSPALAMGISQPLPVSEMGKISADNLLSVLPDQTVRIGQTLEIIASSAYFATEQAKNPVFVARDLPTGATFNPATKKFSWKPTVDGIYSVTISVEDDYLSAERTFNITVPKTELGGGDTNDSNETGDNTPGVPEPGSGTSNDFILPPVQIIQNPTPDAPGPITIFKEVVKERVKTAVNREAIVASITTINSAVQDVLIDPISGQGTTKTTGRLIGILLVIVLPLVAAITIVILRRRTRR